MSRPARLGLDFSAKMSASLWLAVMGLLAAFARECERPDRRKDSLRASASQAAPLQSSPLQGLFFSAPRMQCWGCTRIGTSQRSLRAGGNKADTGINLGQTAEKLLTLGRKSPVQPPGTSRHIGVRMKNLLNPAFLPTGVCMTQPDLEGVVQELGKEMRVGRVAGGMSRPADRSFDCSAMSFTSLWLAVMGLLTAFARECERARRRKRPLAWWRHGRSPISEPFRAVAGVYRKWSFVTTRPGS